MDTFYFIAGALIAIILLFAGGLLIALHHQKKEMENYYPKPEKKLKGLYNKRKRKI